MLNESHQADDVSTLKTWTIFGDANLQTRTKKSIAIKIKHEDLKLNMPFNLTVESSLNKSKIKNAVVSLYSDEFSDNTPIVAQTSALGEATFSIEDLIKLKDIKAPTIKLTITGRNLKVLSQELNIIKEVSWKKINDVAQYKFASAGPRWNNEISRVRGLSLEQAKSIAALDNRITYFVYMKSYMYLEGDFWRNIQAKSLFVPGEAIFFSGSPWYGSAPGMADAYEKK